MTKKTGIIALGTLVTSFLLTVAVAFAQSPTATPTPTRGVSPTTTPSPTQRVTPTPIPTVTVPQGAPATGLGGS